eukprot:10482276-Alexandrium_andersonii.AAC.1
MHAVQQSLYMGTCYQGSWKWGAACYSLALVHGHLDCWKYELLEAPADIAFERGTHTTPHRRLLDVALLAQLLTGVRQM